MKEQNGAVLKISTIVTKIIMVLSTPLVLLVAFAGLFANHPGPQWQQIVDVATISLLHPLAILSILAVFLLRVRWIVRVAVVLSVAALALDLFIAAAILFGITKGDAWLPVLFAIPWVIFLLYMRVRAKFSRAQFSSDS